MVSKQRGYDCTLLQDTDNENNESDFVFSEKVLTQKNNTKIKAIHCMSLMFIVWPKIKTGSLRIRKLSINSIKLIKVILLS